MPIVLNRECNEVPFDKTKISTAILKAMKNGSGIVKPRIAERIADEIEEETKDLDEITISDIEEKVYDKLVKKKQKLTAKAYYGYQKIREFQRENENTIDQEVEELIEDQNDYWASENANKNPILNTTKRDYMAGIISTDATKRYLLPPDIVQAHNEGILHFHDADYFLQHMHNCFTKDTKFYTSDGIKSFADFEDGDSVRVLDKDGTFQDATVHYYGKRDMVKIKFSSYKKEKTVICTHDHRWILKDGTVTTKLKVGDQLLGIQKEKVDLSVLTQRQCEMFSLGLLLIAGCDMENRTGEQFCQVQISNQYVDIMKQSGYTIKDDNTAIKKGNEKNAFLDHESWTTLSEEDKKYLFLGIYKANNSLSFCTQDKRIVKLMKDISFAAGYYITDEIRVKDTSSTTRYELTFITEQKDITSWKVESVKPYKENMDAWCVEEPITHSFTLDGGMITGNCDLINLEDMLQNGTVISEVLIENPHSFSTACTVTTQIIAQVASNQYGGQSFSLEHLAPFVDVSRQKIKKEVMHELKDILNIVNDDAVDKIVEERLKEEITKGIQTIQYQLTTIMTTNGQSPFVTIFMYLNEAKNKQEKHDLAMLIEEVLRQRIQGVKNEEGVFIAPAFPKLIYVTEEDNISEDAPYWYLTKLAAECSAKRLVPDYISEKMMLELKGDVYTCMGCRSFLTPDRFSNKVGNVANAGNYEEGKHKYYGRFNCGVVTINLVDVALSSEGDEDTFWALFDERLNLAHKALQLRVNRLLGTSADVSPILWRYGALARLDKNEKIDKLIYNGYATLSLGYAGLYECVKYMTGKSHSDEGIGEKFGLQVMQHMNDKCNEWKSEENIDYSIYGTPKSSRVA